MVGQLTIFNTYKMSGIKIHSALVDKWVTIAASDAAAIRLSNSGLKADNVHDGFTELNNKFYNLKNNVAWIYKNGTIGGGGTGPGGTTTGKVIITNITDNPHYISTAENFSISYMVQSRLTTNFTVSLKIDQQTTITRTIRPNTQDTWNIGRLSKGTHVIFISGVDVDQMPIDSATQNVIAGAVEISSTFNDAIIFNVSSDINIPYTVSSYLTAQIDVDPYINTIKQDTIRDVPKDRLMQYNIGKRPIGTYNVTLQAFSGGFSSNKLEYTINVASTDQLFLSVTSAVAAGLRFNRGIPIKFAYTVAVLGYTSFITSYKINGKTGELNSRLGTNVFEIGSDDLPPGDYVLELTARDIDNVIHTNEILKIPITITATDFVPFEPHPSGLIAHFKARGVSESETVKWENSVRNSPITCDLIGINARSNGFIGSTSTSSIDKSLVINGEAYARINYKPFSQDKQVLTNGCTISVIYRTKNVGNKKARVLDCANYNENTDGLIAGIYIDTEDSELRSSNISTPVKIGQNEWINETFVIDQNFLSIFNDGIITGAVNHTGSLGTDFLVHDGYIYLGCRAVTRTVGTITTTVLTDFADCDIKDVKIYNRALTDDQVVYNVVGDDYYLNTVSIGGVLQFDEEKQKRLRALNSMNEQGEFVLDMTATSPFPVLEITFKDTATMLAFRAYVEKIVWATGDDKDRQFECIINYKDYKNNRFLNDHPGYISLQGTSSMGYTSKNFEIYLGKMNDGNTDFLYTPKVNWLPENRFTLKCNMMDSSHANNVGTGRLINYGKMDVPPQTDPIVTPGQGYFRAQIPPKVDPTNNNRTKVRDAIEGFPILMSMELGRTNQNGDPDNYLGVYTFNMGRGSFFNMGMKNADFEELNGVVTSVVEKPVGNYAPDRAFAFEIDSSYDYGSGAFVQISNDWINKEFTQRFPTNESTEGFNQLKNAIQKTAFSGPPSPVRDLLGNIIYEDDGVTPKLTHTVQQQFVENAGCWNLPSLADYIILAYALGMVDNLGKNLLLKTWNKEGPTGAQQSVWWATFYDMDTILGLSNVGIIRYGPDLDMDVYPTGDFVFDQANPANRGAGQYNLSRSRLWELYKQNYYRFESRPENEPTSFNLLQRYTNLRTSGVLSYDNIMNKYMSVIDSIGANYYNKDARIKYMNLFTNEAGASGYHNLTFLHGTREHYTKLWLKRRLTYLDSLFDASSTNMPGNTAAQGLKFRFNRGTAAIGKREINVRSISPTFITMYWRGEDDPADYSKLLVRNETPRLFSRDFAANDQSTSMNFGPEVMYLDGLNTGNPSTLDLSNASNLISLQLSNNQFLQSLNVDGCTSLRYLNVSNCSKLGEAGSEDPRPYLNMRACLNLQEVDVSFTKLSQVLLPLGGTLKTLRCNDSSINTLDLSNQSFLEEVDLTNCRNLNSIKLTDCKSLKRLILTNTAITNFQASNCPELQYVDISYNGSLVSIDFNGTPKMETLNLSYCNNSELKEFNLIGCPRLKSLTTTGSSATLYRFPTLISTLQVFQVSSSGIERTRFGGTSSTDDDKWTTYPAVNMAQFTGLTSLNMNTCKNLRAVTNINVTLTNPGGIFANCSNLLRITGKMTFTGNVGNMFANCTMYKPYDSTTNANGVVLPSDTATFPVTFDLNAVTNASSMCYGCSAIDIGHMYYFMRRLPNVTLVTSMFFDCKGIVTNNNRPFPEALFEKSTKITNMTSFCQTNTNISGPLLANTFAPLSSVTNTYRAFSGCKFTDIDQSFLRGMINLSVAEEMFNANNIQSIVPAASLFVMNTKLTNIASMFANNPQFEVRLGDDELFRNNPLLTNISSAFSGCRTRGTLHPNFFGGVTPTATGPNGEQWKWPVNLENISGLFEGNSLNSRQAVSGTFDPRLFANLTKLQNASAAFAYTEMSGPIPGDLFRYNYQLVTINGLFAGSEKLQGSIPTELFKTLNLNNEEVFLVRVLNASSLFSGCWSLTGEIPEDLFQWTPRVTTVANCFYDCGTINHNDNPFGLIGPIPEKLLWNLTDLTTTASMFYRCNKLKPHVIPAENPLDPEILHMIPLRLFRDCGKVTSTAGMFQWMAIGGEIPLGVFDPLRAVTNMSGMFYSAMTTQTLNRDLFIYNNRLTDISLMFSDDSVSSNPGWNKVVPSDLFRKYVTSPIISGNPIVNVTSLFAKKSGIRGNAIKFWEFGTVRNTANCYLNCTALTDYASIPAVYK